MTEEIMRLSARELREYQKGVDAVCKVHGLTPKELDMFFLLVKNAGKVIDTLNSITESQIAIERELNMSSVKDPRNMAAELKKAVFGGGE